MDIGVIVWGIFFSFLKFVYEYFLYDVLGYFCLQKNISKWWYNDLLFNLRLYFKVKNKQFFYKLYDLFLIIY